MKVYDVHVVVTGDGAKVSMHDLDVIATMVSSGLSAALNGIRERFPEAGLTMTEDGEEVFT